MRASFPTLTVRHCLLAVALLLSTFPASAQKQGQELIDSLLQTLPARHSDTTRVKLLCRIGNEYGYIDPEVGIRYASQALALASEKGWQRGVASAVNILGICELYRGNYGKASQHWERALGIYKQTGDKQGVLKVVGNMGALSVSQGDYAKALDHYFEALRSAEDLADQYSIAINLGNIGGAYNYLLNNKKSLEYYEKAVALFMSLGDRQSAAIFLGNIGHIYREEKVYGAALRYADSALKLSAAVGDNENSTRMVFDIGKIHEEKGEYGPALEQLNRALSMARKTEFKSLEAGVLTQLGEIFLKLAADSSGYRSQMPRMAGVPSNREGLIQTAAAYFRQSIAIDSGSASLDQLRINYADLSQALALSGQYRDALTAYR